MSHESGAWCLEHQARAYTAMTQTTSPDEYLSGTDGRTADDQLGCYYCGRGSVPTIMVGDTRVCYQCREVGL